MVEGSGPRPPSNLPGVSNPVVSHDGFIVSVPLSPVSPHHFALRRRLSQLDCPRTEAEQDGGFEAADATLAGAVVSAPPRFSSRDGRGERALRWVVQGAGVRGVSSRT